MKVNLTDDSALNGGQLIVRALEIHGTKRVFCVPGESYLPVLDALHDSDIQTTVCRHEGAASMMAEATAKLDGAPGICLVTRGPGATNASAGLHIALQDSTPMIIFIGQIGVHLREREAFQEVDYRRFFGASVKWVAEIDSAERIDEFVSRAFHTATSGRPGPVALVLPESTLSAVAQPLRVSPWHQLETHPGQGEVQQLASMIANARSPIAILGGSRWNAKAVNQMQQFAQQWQLPVACSFRRQMLFDHLHPNYAGDVGIGINPQLADTVRQSDLVILLGGRFSEMPSQEYTLLDVPCPQQPLVHVYPGAEELGRVYRSQLAINASPVALLDALEKLPLPDKLAEQRRTFVDQCHANYLSWSRPELSTPGDVQMSHIIGTMQSNLPDNAIVTNGAGNYASWIHRFWKFRRYGSQLAPTSGTMGYGLPAAIAGKLHQPDRCVIAFAGDGCLQMTLQEIGTAMQYQVNIIIVVVDNGIYGTIRMHQERHFPGRVSGTDLHNPDFAALAQAYGAIGLTVNHTDEFEAAFSTALAATTPALLHLKVSPEAITPTTTLTSIRESVLEEGQAR
ncbi:MAG: thiamine pyrophosphate-binding protein [Granulosicoccus sp.]